LFRFAEGLVAQTSAKPTQGVWGHAPSISSGFGLFAYWMIFFFFKKKKRKALFRFAEGVVVQTSAKPTLGVWGRAPKKTINIQVKVFIGLVVIFFFQKKKQKALSASRKV
jgi:hypothetical protein